MDRLRFTEILPYGRKDLMDLVMDAARYKEISTLIQRVDVSHKNGGTIGVDVIIEAPVLPVAIRYGCDLTRIEPGTIKAVATKSPFSAMTGQLTFTALPDGQTQVDCVVDYKTGWNPIAIIAAGVMESQIGAGVEYAKRYLAQRLAPVTPPAGLAPVP